MTTTETVSMNSFLGLIDECIDNMTDSDCEELDNIKSVGEMIKNIIAYYEPTNSYKSYKLSAEMREYYQELKHTYGMGYKMVEIINHSIYLDMITSSCILKHDYTEYDVIMGWCKE
jgi:hypothetical protein